MRSPMVDRNRKAYDATMTPMIDVIFQLQIFFLCTAGFALPESILPTQLPATGAVNMAQIAEPLDLEIVRVVLRGTEANLSIQLNDRTLGTLGALRGEIAKLGAISTALPVVLDIGPSVELGVVVDVYDTCLAAGLKKINFAAAKPRG